jgi:hypothetical protein
MAVTLKLSAEQIGLAKPYAAAMHRSVAQQIEYWARLRKTVEEDPELPVQFVQDTLLAVEEAKAGLLAEYRFPSS